MTLLAHNSEMPIFILEDVLDNRQNSEIVLKVDSYLNHKCGYEKNIELLNEAQRIFLLIGNIEKELNHGGFKQFYNSKFGNYANETVDVLLLIGAYETGQIVKTANDQFPDGNVPSDFTERMALIGELDGTSLKVWEDCNEKFYMHEYNFEERLVQFLKDNIESFEK